jgi:hypothetical protein
MEQPRVWRWQLSIQRELDSTTVAEIAYAGARGLHLMGLLGVSNPVRPDVQADGRMFFPEDGERLNPAFDSVGMRRPQFNSFSHGFTASLRHARSDGLSVRANYAFGKSIDEASSDVLTDFEHSDRLSMPLDYRANRGPSDFDIRHAATVSFSYAIPSDAQGPARHFVNGWELSGIVQAQSGNPFSAWVGSDRARVDDEGGDLGQRPDLAAAPGADLILGDSQEWFDTTAFSLPEEGYYGDVGRGVLMGPGLFSLDLSVQKDIWSNERHSVLLRGEFFNLTNHPNFAVPNGLDLFNS